MDLIQRMNTAIEYVEDNLEGVINYQQIAKKALSSEYHFSRLFSALTSINISEYIRRRRLTKAAFDLQHTNLRVLDIAIKYGYSSADSFTRAFYKAHGVNPSLARNKGIKLKAYPKISFQITIKGVTEMLYKIEKLPNQKIIGKSFKVITKDAFQTIPKLWQQAHENGLVDELISIGLQSEKNDGLINLLGVCGKIASITDEEFNYFIGIRYNGEVNYDLENLILPANKWAVFSNVTEAWQRVYSEWLPYSQYNLANCPCVECYYPPNHEIDSELWIPVL